MTINKQMLEVIAAQQAARSEHGRRVWENPESRARLVAALRRVRGNSARWSKLKPVDIERMHELRRNGWTQARIANELGVSTNTIRYRLQVKSR